MTKLLGIIVVSLSLALAAGGCKKKDGEATKASLKDRAKALAAKYGPKLGELSKKLPGLASHAKDLPVDVPGADRFGKLLEENKSTLAEAQELLAKLPEKLGSESEEQAEKDLAAAEQLLDKDVAVIEKDEQEEAAIIKAAEAKAAAGSAAP